MQNTKLLYHGHRFPATVISAAFRRYFGFPLSLCDIEALFFKRGVIVSYETVRRWCNTFGMCFAQRVKAARRKPGTTWHHDEVFLTLSGVPHLLWRTADQHGAELDILLQTHRDNAAAKRFFKRVLAQCAEAPRKIVTYKLRSYPASKPDIPAQAHVKHVFVKASAQINNRDENSHQSTCERERSAILNARRLSYRASVRSGRSSRSSDTRYAPHSIANTQPHGIVFTEATQDQSVFRADVCPLPYYVSDNLTCQCP
jgi:putative transposase